MDNYKTSQKFEILKQALDERYSAMKIIRDRIQTISLWILPITLGCAGYLFAQNFYPICKFEKALLIITILSVYISIIYYIKDLEKGFSGQREVASKIEEAFGLFEKDTFIEGDSIYPESWNGVKKGNYINLNYILITVGFLILLFAILLYL